MAKSSGLGSGLFVGTADLSGDTGSLSGIETSITTLEVTGIDKSAPERVVGLKDGKLAFTAFWNTVAGAAHPVLGSAIARTDVQVSYIHASTLGEAAASMVAKQLNYNPSRGTDGSLTSVVNATANGYGLEWGELLTTGKQTFASGTATTTGIDLQSAFGTAFGTATAFGAAGYLHQFSVASGTPTVAIQDSNDNITFADVTGMVFTASAAATTERKQGSVTATVQRYVRVRVTGTYTTLVAAVNFVRYFATP